MTPHYMLRVLFSPANWFLAKPFQSCHITCDDHGLTCSNDKLRERDVDVNTSEKLKGILRRIGVWTGNPGCGRSDHAPPGFKESDFPLVYPGDEWRCFISRPGRTEDSFDCLRKPPEPNLKVGIPKQRLCYCHKPSKYIQRFFSKLAIILW